MKNIYEIFDEFEEAKSKKDRMDIIGKNLSKTLHDVLLLTFHPDYKFKIKELPEDYKPNQSNLPGLSYAKLSTEIRKLYMFQEGNATAESLTDKKRKQLLLELLNILEPREAEVIMGIFNKDQGVKGLTYKFVKEAFPNMLP
jgi:hypothetical protein